MKTFTFVERLNIQALKLKNKSQKKFSGTMHHCLWFKDQRNRAKKKTEGKEKKAMESSAAQEAAASNTNRNISIKIKTIDDRSYNLIVPLDCRVNSLKERIKVRTVKLSWID
jgi:hypothetical protein